MEELLTAKDRCDACGAEAKVKAKFINGELLFCGHHAREYSANLTQQSMTIDDPNNELKLYEPQLF